MGHLCGIPSLKVQKHHGRREGKILRTRGRGYLWQNSILQTRWGHYPQQLTALGLCAQDLDNIKPAKIPAWVGRTHLVHPLAEELLLMVDGFLGMESPFSTRMWSLDSTQTPLDVLTPKHRQTALSGFSRLKNSTQSWERKVEMGQGKSCRRGDGGMDLIQIHCICDG